jgi:hypothetical protein
MVQLLLDSDPGQVESRVVALGERYARVLDMKPDDFGSAVRVARVHMAEMAASLKIEPALRARARRLMPPAAPTASPASVSDAAVVNPRRAGAPAAAAAAAARQVESAHDATVVMAVPPGDTAEAEARLSATIAEITTTMAADTFKLNEVLGKILGTIHQALALDHVVFCLRDARTGLLAGRVGLGPGGDAMAKRFTIDARGPLASDLFAAACLKGADTVIADGRAASLATRLPAWYRAAPAHSFMLLPMMIKGAPFALIYADRAERGIDFCERELTLLRTLRNQAVMAFKAAG